MASLYKYRNKYHIAYTVNGKRKTTNTGIEVNKDNLSKAKKIKQEIEYKIESGHKKFSPENSFNNLINSDNNMTLAEAVKKCTIERIEGKSDSHVRNMDIAMKHLYKTVEPDTPIGVITSAHISQCIRLIQSKVANATLHSYIRYLKILFNFLVEEDYIIKTPVKKKLIPKRERNNIIIFKDTDLDNILNVAKERDSKYYNCLKLLLYTGLRPIDLLRLKVSDFDFTNKRINIKISKTKKEIKYPLYNELEEFIISNMQDEFNGDKESFVFKDFNVEILGKRFRRIKKHLRISEKYLTLRTFRKTFATRIAGKGLPIHEVAYLLGHDSVKTTEKYYADVIANNLRDKINSLNESSKSDSIIDSISPEK